MQFFFTFLNILSQLVHEMACWLFKNRHSRNANDLISEPMDTFPGNDGFNEHDELHYTYIIS